MEGKSRSQTLELFFIDGRPDGMLTAEVFNWTGHVLVAPRTQIRDALIRPQACYTGVYLLLGDNDGEPLAYIGEADDVSSRIRNHDTVKYWWDSAVIITTTSNSLNKAHTRYLESRLIEEARKIGKTRLENSTTPGRPVLSEAAQANMEVFLEYVLMILPALRIDSFLRSTRPEFRPVESAGSQSEAPVFEISKPRQGLLATAKLINGEFVVQAGSLARKTWVGKASENTGYFRLHGELVRTGVLREHKKHRIFTQNYAFKSPSAAAAVINGRASAGPIEWKVIRTRKTYKDWEAEQLSAENFQVIS